MFYKDADDNVKKAINKSMQVSRAKHFIYEWKISDHEELTDINIYYMMYYLYCLHGAMAILGANSAVQVCLYKS